MLLKTLWAKLFGGPTKPNLPVDYKWESAPRVSSVPGRINLIVRFSPTVLWPLRVQTAEVIWMSFVQSPVYDYREELGREKRL